MKNLARLILIICFMLGAGSLRLEANFCGGDASTRAMDEAKALKDELFSKPVTGDTINLGANQSYNARVISCNRKRDTKGNKIEKEIGVLHKFSDKLTPKTVKGHFSYMGLGIFSQLRYAYQLSREGGNWVVTLPIEFHWPAGRMPDMVDIPEELAESLNLHLPGEICEPGKTVYSKENPRRVKKGYINAYLGKPQSEIFVQDQIAMDVPPDQIVSRREDVKPGSTAEGILDASYDIMYYWEEASCRVPRDMVINKMSVLNHLRLYWKKSITETWNRPGFEIRPVFIRCEKAPKGTKNACDSPSQSEISAWEKDETIWPVRFNLKPFHRPSFKRWVAKWNHMHTGTDGTTIGHELGHYLGLDDEYGENDAAKKDCENILPGASEHYIMCDSDAGRAGAQGVYPWIITRRYAIAEEYQCKDDSDCDPAEFCDKGTASIGRNACKNLRLEGEACSRDGQCEKGAICKGKPVGKCIFEASVSMGGACIKDAQCKTGSCDKDGRCQCKAENDCDPGQYCKNTAVGKNSCVNFKKIGSSCSQDSQCAPPAVCKGKPFGKCIVESSKGLGDSCTKDAECRVGKCGSNNRCQCAKNSDCPDGKNCKEPVGKPNYCE